MTRCSELVVKPTNGFRPMSLGSTRLAVKGRRREPFSKRKRDAHNLRLSCHVNWNRRDPIEQESSLLWVNNNESQHVKEAADLPVMQESPDLGVPRFMLATTSSSNLCIIDLFATTTRVQSKKTMTCAKTR